MFADAYLPIPGKGQFLHRFGGPLRVSMSECPNCCKPFVTFCTLDTKDPRIDLVGVAGELPLIYCMRCASFTGGPPVPLFGSLILKGA